MKLKYFNLARKSSKKSDHKHKLGAVVVKGNKVLSLGFNKVKTHPKSPHNFKTIHAEFDAINEVKYDDLRNADIYVYRETKDGKMADSFPCQYCQQLIEMYEFRNIFYTTENRYARKKLR